MGPIDFHSIFYTNRRQLFPYSSKYVVLCLGQLEGIRQFLGGLNYPFYWKLLCVKRVQK